jgi:hypothetical protein
MKEKPILFSTPMVQAILEGRKTMTRRIVKTTQNGWNAQNMEFVKSENIAESFFINRTASPSLKKELTGFHAFFKDNESDHKLGTMCKYGQPGDVLWVRETWCLPSLYDGFEKDFYFKAGFSPSDIKDKNASGLYKPSIHMPKAAARIWLQVEEIRVERLRDITEKDAIDEGMKFHNLFGEWGGVVAHPKVKNHFNWYSNPVDAFMNLWITINGQESYKANPWVWVVKFKVLSTTGKPQPETRNP